MHARTHACWLCMLLQLRERAMALRNSLDGVLAGLSSRAERLTWDAVLDKMGVVNTQVRAHACIFLRMQD